MSMFLKKAPDGTTSFRLIIDQERDYLNSCFLLKTAAPLDKDGTAFTESWLRSWVQLPPGPFLSVLELRYLIKLISYSMSDKKPSNDSLLESLINAMSTL
jgi:hypothetical protein